MSNKKRNKKPKSVGNGNGSEYFSEALQKMVFQYYVNGKRKTLTQKKNETVRDFKKKVTDIKSKLDNGTFIEKSNETVISIAKEFVERKHNNKETSDVSYVRDLETIKQIEKTCSNFCYLPIQKVKLNHIEEAKPLISNYAKETIDKIWIILGKVFSIASSPSRGILAINIFKDEELKKPLSNKKTKKVKALKHEEYLKLISILDNEEKDHKYRDIVKMQIASAMRIGEALARTFSDYDKVNQTFHIHNTVTKDTNYKAILGKHTKTYDKKNQEDRGERYLPLEKELFKDLNTIIKKQLSKKTSNINNLIFWDYKKNKLISGGAVNSWLDRINEKYQICEGKLSTHRLRHTTITRWYYIEGLDLATIQYLAGHVEGSDITTDVYIETNLENIRQKIV